MVTGIRNLRVVWAASVLLLVPHLALGQGVTAVTGSINGTVKDSSGAVVPGVTVAIESPSQMGTRTATTNLDGSYRFVALPPGDYAVTFTLPGFADMRYEDIRVSVGFTATVDAQMQPAAMEEQVTVTGQSPVVDRAATVVGTTFNASTVANLPNSRDMQAMFLQTPAITVRAVDVGGSQMGVQPQWTVYGTNTQSRFLVEGIDTSEANSSTGFYLNFGAFEEVQVNTAAISAEMPNPGVQVQLISKSGSNRYSGSVFGNYENGKIQSYNIDADQIARGVTGGGGLAPRDVNRMSSFADLDGTVGGYLKKDRVWWHSAMRAEQVKTRATNFPGQMAVTNQWNADFKTTIAATQNQRIIGYAAWTRKLVPARFNSFLTGITPIFATQADTSYQDFRAGIGKAEWNGILSDRTFAEARVGYWYYVSPFAKQPKLTSGPHYEDLTTGVIQGTSVDRYLYTWRPQVSAAVSTVRGSHTLKTGLEVFQERYRFIVNQGSFADTVHVLQNGAPIEVYLMQNPTENRSLLNTLAGYVTDTWRPTERLSVNLGLRFDRYHASLPEQTHPAGQFYSETVFPAVDNLYTWNLLAPRLGAAFALDGSQRTILKANFGIYRWSPATRLGNSVNPNPNFWWQRHTWADVNGNRVWDAGEEGRLLGTSGGTGSAILDPNIEDTFTREVAGWLEREVGGATAIRTGVVWRGDRQAYRAINRNQPFDGFSVPVTIADPGPDGVTGNSDDGPLLQGFNLAQQYLGLPTVNVVTNVPNSDASFWTWEASAVRRLRNRWALMASGSYTWSTAQALPGSNPPLFSPNRSINAGPNGELKFTSWTMKFHATWEGPKGVMVTPMLMHESGQNFGRTIQARFNFGTTAILAEPVNSRRMPNITMLDTRVEKRFKLGSDMRTLGVFLDGLNLLNANPEQQLVMASGSSFLRPTQILSPRILRIGARLNW